MRINRNNPALMLGLCTLLCTTLVGITWFITRDNIEQSEQRLLRERLQQVVSGIHYDNDLIQDTLNFPGTQSEMTVYRAFLGSEPVAAVFDTITAEGYAGEIRLLVGVNYDGSVLGVRVINHRETPGLGDDIELSRSDWIRGFDQQSLKSLNERQWRVKKDGGEFDQFTGATITPRAVVNAVYTVLRDYRDHRDTLFDR